MYSTRKKYHWLVSFNSVLRRDRHLEHQSILQALHNLLALKEYLLILLTLKFHFPDRVDHVVESVRINVRKQNMVRFLKLWTHAKIKFYLQAIISLHVFDLPL